MTVPKRKSSLPIMEIVLVVVVAALVVFIIMRRTHFMPFANETQSTVSSTEPTPQGCPSAANPPILILPLTKYRDFNGQTSASVVMRESECVIRGEVTVFLATYWTKPPTSEGRVLDEAVLKAKVKSIEPIAANDLSAELLASFGFANVTLAKNYVQAIEVKRGLNPAPGWEKIDFDLKGRIALKNFWQAPQSIGFGKIISKNGLEPVLSTGAILIDVRDPHAFALHHHPKAINITYQNEGLDRFHLKLHPETPFDVKPLEPYKGHPLVFIGESADDNAAARAVFYAYKDGWRDLFWLRGGEFERLDILKEPAGQYAGVEVIKAPELAEFLEKKRGKIVDVRLQPRYESEHILDAVSVPYREYSVTERSPEKMKRELFQKAGDQFDVQSLTPPGNEIVVYGGGPNDFRAVKAALWLKELGWKRVHWYREGGRDWLQHKKEEPDRYRTNVGVPTLKQ